MSMDKIDNMAWDVLNNDEKTAITLSLSFGKSSWEAGEIMNKAHFKYLEIQKRAIKFLEMFTNHFAKYNNSLFTENTSITFSFKEYLHLTLTKRLNPPKAAKEMENTSYLVSSLRKNIIIREITKLQKSKITGDNDLYNLIMDFDRWNNFRILPIEIQEPSAFKRRNKSRNIKHLKNITTLPQYSILKLVEKYGKTGKGLKIYLPLVSEYLDDDYKVLAVNNNKINIKEISDIGLLLFEEEKVALEFSLLVSSYFINSIKSCKTGQKFWPIFRVLMSKAINYKELENIHKSRQYLEKALFDTDGSKVKKSHETISKGEHRGTDKDFY